MSYVVPLNPSSWGVELSITCLNYGGLPIQYSKDVKLIIRRKGCADCAQDITYSVLEDSWPTLKFKFDSQILSLRKGRYIGIITVGCETVECPVEWIIGQKLCVEDVKPLQFIDDCNKPDPLTLENPNCIKCEEPVNEGCPCDWPIVQGELIQFKYEFTGEQLGCSTFKMKQVEVPTCS